MIGAGALEGDLSPGDAQRGEERARFDPVGDHRVVDGQELVDAHDLDRRRAATNDAGADARNERAQVGYLRLPRRVLDHRRALGPDRGHQEVLGCTDARKLEHHTRPDEVVTAGLDVAVGGLEPHTEGFQAADVHVDRPRPEVVAAREGDAREAVAGEQGSEHDNRRSHALDELVGRLGRDVGTDVDGDHVILGATHVGTHRGEEVAHDLDVDDARDVSENGSALGHEARRHQLEYGVLRPLDGNRALQGPTAPHDDALHALSMVSWCRAS